MYRGMPGGLFAGKDLPAEAKDRTDNALELLRRADVNELLSRDIELLVDELVETFEPVTIRWDEATMTEPKHVQVGGVTDAFGRPITHSVAQSEVKVPLDGEATLLTYRSHNGAPALTIEGEVRPAIVSFIWTGELEANPEEIERWFEQRRSQVERFLLNNNNDITGLNGICQVK